MRRAATAAAVTGLLALAACGSTPAAPTAQCRNWSNLGEAWLARGEAALSLPAGPEAEQQLSQAAAEGRHYLRLMQAQHCPEVAK